MYVNIRFLFEFDCVSMLKLLTTIKILQFSPLLKKKNSIENKTRSSNRNQ